MSSTKYPHGLVAVHTRVNTTTRHLDLATDHGRFADDLADLGYGLVITNRNTFSDGNVKIASRSKTDDSVTYTDAHIDPEDILAIHSRMVIPLVDPVSDLIPKINSNNLKHLVSSKFNLYEKVLSNEQVPTWFISMNPDDYNASIESIKNIDTTSVVLKANKGSGGYTTKIHSKKAAIKWINGEMLKPEPVAQILQALIDFGTIPEGVYGVSDYAKELIVRARKENLLTELRIFTLKRNDEFDTVPVLRIVPDKNLPMQGRNDVYLDVRLSDELYESLRASSIRITNKVCEEAGNDQFAIGAVDYYFDKHGVPRVAEANFRSPQLPTTNTTPIAGRAVFQSTAKTLHVMAKSSTKT
jgi:hypothetical protein